MKTISLEITKEKHKCFQREETHEQHSQKWSMREFVKCGHVRRLNGGVFRRE